MTEGVYRNSTHEQIEGTVRELRWYREFIRSDSEFARDPWALDGYRFTRREAQTRLTWMIDTAINRKAGQVDDPHARVTAPMNHLGRFPRRRTGDAQSHLYQLAGAINRPRLMVHTSTLGEWGPYLLRAIPHRFSRYDD